MLAHTIFVVQKSLLEHRAFLLALISLAGIGPRTVLKILDVCQKKQLSRAEFWANKHHIWQEIELKEKTIESIKKFKKEHSLLDNLSQLEASGIQLTTFEEPTYPPLLSTIEDLPIILFVKSHVKIGSEAWSNIFSNTISIVGTRKITGYGRLVINRLIPPLVDAHQVIVSGFMYGVDLLSAQTALNHQGQTIAVLGFGFNYCFPSSQKKIMHEFLERGAVFLTEFVPPTLARASNFVTRNRIVAGLSKATVIIEAAKHSGSHITASYANNYGRLVMAVPGPITNSFSEGTKELINQGAILVNNAQDILREIGVDYHLNLLNSKDVNKNSVSNNNENKLLLESLSFYPELSFENLQKNTQISVDKLNQLLFDLELQGKIIKKWGKYCLVS